VQRRIVEHRQEAGGRWPDLSDLVDDAKDAVSDLGSGALVKVANTLNSSLEKMLDKVNEFSDEVNETADKVKVGVATILGKSLNVTIKDIPMEKEYEEKAFDLLDKGILLWEATTKAIKAGVTTIDTGLATVAPEELRKTFNDSAQAAIAGSEGVVASMQALKEALEKQVSAADEDESESKESLLQTKRQADVDPEEVLADLKQQVGGVSTQAETFSQSISEAFESLSTGVTDTVKDKLNANSLKQVQDAFNELLKTAKNLGIQVQKASAGLLGGVKEAEAAAAEAAGVKSLAAEPSGRFGGLLVATAAALYISL